MDKVFVTKPFLPPREDLERYIDRIYQTKILTNQGPLLKEFEKLLKDYLGVENLHFVTNGTLALQLALRSLDIEEGSEILTTPFSYVATCSSILWERFIPIFIDIKEENFTIDPEKIEKKIGPKTKAILATHVFGYACDVERIKEIADKHSLKIIYDGAHCFGSKYKGKALSLYGDISTLSFHATKLFNTIEGGACITKDQKISKEIGLKKRFGHYYDEYETVGINAKASEFQAAMGLANFPYLSEIISHRKHISKIYDEELKNTKLKRPKTQDFLEYNYSYHPIIFESEEQLVEVLKALKEEEIYPRRYFYPSLNELKYVEYSPCPISEEISRKIACLPLYSGLEEETAKKICKIIKKGLSNE